jgi:hypothetical protein
MRHADFVFLALPQNGRPRIIEKAARISFVERVYHSQQHARRLLRSEELFWLHVGLEGLAAPLASVFVLL